MVDKYSGDSPLTSLKNESLSGGGVALTHARRVASLCLWSSLQSNNEAQLQKKKKQRKSKGGGEEPSPGPRGTNQARVVELVSAINKGSKGRTVPLCVGTANRTFRRRIDAAVGGRREIRQKGTVRDGNRRWGVLEARDRRGKILTVGIGEYEAPAEEGAALVVRRSARCVGKQEGKRRKGRIMYEGGKNKWPGITVKARVRRRIFHLP